MGPQGSANGDRSLFLGDPPGDYEFILNQASVGDWPGRAIALVADLDLR